MNATLCLPESGFAVSPTLLSGRSTQARDILRRVLRIEDGSPTISAQGPTQRLIEGAERFVLEAAEHPGSGTLQLETLLHAVRFTSLIPSYLPGPEISMDEDGSVSFDWVFGKKSRFAVNVDRDGNVHYAGLYGIGRSHGVELLRDALPKPVFEGLSRAFSENSKAATE